MIQLEKLSSCHQWCINYASGIHLVTRQMCSSCLCLCNWIGLFVFFHWCINYASCIQLGDTSNVFFIVCATKLSAAKTGLNKKKFNVPVEPVLLLLLLVVWLQQHFGTKRISTECQCFFFSVFLATNWPATWPNLISIVLLLAFAMKLKEVVTSFAPCW